MTPTYWATSSWRQFSSTECSPEVHVTKSRPSAASYPVHRALFLWDSIEVRHFICRVRVPDDPAKAILLGNILRLGRAALALEHAREEERNRAALWPADPIESQGGAIFLAEEMQSILNVARRIAPTNVPVLITGETGTGKEVLARTIHACSTRAQSTFLPFNCTSTPKDMLDSQLFGHRRGAFTGAVDNFQGVVRAAAGGTLFLDEIGDTSLEVQPKLLRFLESNEIHPIGESQPSRVDVRLIVATNADLDTLVSQGRFREDLFYRLSIVRLHLPPLRERRVEIPTLANHYLQKFAQEYAKGDLRLAEDTMEYLVLYRWPGNTRQLANEMRRLAALAESGAVMMPEHLSPEIAASRRTIPASERILDPTEVVVRLDQPMAGCRSAPRADDDSVRNEEVWRTSRGSRGDAGRVAQGTLLEAPAVWHRSATRRSRCIRLRESRLHACGHSRQDVAHVRASLAHPRGSRPRSHLHRFGLRVEHVQPADSATVPGFALVVQPTLHDVHHRARAPRPERRIRWPLGRAPRAARRRHRRRAVLRHRTAHWRVRPRAVAAGARVPRHGNHRRHRLWSRLHLAGQHAGEVVSRSTRHGDRHGHHGIRRRRVSRRLPQRLLHGSDRRGQNGDGTRRHLHGHHAGRRTPAAAPACGLAA